MSIVFDLESGRTFDDVIRELSSGELRIGVESLSTSTGGIGASYVNVAAPEPSTTLLLGLGLALLMRSCAPARTRELAPMQSDAERASTAREASPSK